MRQNFWELGLVKNKYDDPAWQGDCQVTIISFGSEREWTSNKGVTYVYREVTVQGPDNCTLSKGFEVTYLKGQSTLTDDMVNKPLACSVKIAESQHQNSHNGRKYTFQIGEKPASSGASVGGGGSYQKASPEEVRGKCWTLFTAAAIGRIGSIALEADEAEQAAIIRHADNAVTFSKLSGK